MPIFIKGMIINFQNCTNWHYRYIVDHCAHQDDINAYLKIICYTQDRRTCESWSQHPPILLAVPLSQSKVRMHPNAPTSITCTESQDELPCPASHSNSFSYTFQGLRNAAGEVTRVGQKVFNFLHFWKC